MHSTSVGSRTTPITGVGNGFNSLFQSAMPSQLQINGLEPVAAKQNMDVYVCTSTADLYQNLGITAAIAAGTTFGSFKTRIELVNEIQSSFRSVTILVVYHRITGGNSLTNAGFIRTPTDALSLYRQGGDSYVSSVSTGGFYIAALSYATYDETTFQNVKAQADADFSGWKGTLNAEFAANITNLANNTHTTSTFHQRGEGFTSPLPDRNTFMSFMNGFGSPDFQLDLPAVLDFSLQPYTNMEGCPAGFRVIDGYIDSWTGRNSIHPGASLTAIAETVLASEQLLNGVQTMYDFYGCLAAEPKLATAKAQYTKILSDLDAWLKEVDEDPTKPGIAVPTISPDDLKYPIAQYSLLSGPVGPGGGGDTFADIQLSMIGRLVRPSRVAVHSGDSVDKIDFTYSMVLGDDSDSWYVSRGGGGGDWYAAIDFGPGEVILRAGPLWWGGDGLVKSVDFVTTTQTVQLGRQGSAPYNCVWDKTDTTCLVGFAGRAGRYFDALGVQYVQFQPCKWATPPTTQGLKARSTKPAPISGLRDPGALDRDGTPVDLVISPDRLLKAFLTTNAGKVLVLYGEKGGWENWLQCELAYDLRNNFSRPGYLDREKSDVYANAPAQRCDLFLTERPVGNFTPETIVIELKAAGVRRSPTDLFNGVRDDIAKMFSPNPRINKFNPRWGRVQAFAFGAFVANDPDTVFGAYNGWGGNSTKPTLVKIGNTVDHLQLALVMWNYKNYT
ncbi:uncharacterized protein K489DRAFT_17565 [Dissoconium aciculare CBS 342.82]|uniref:Jacalin-type lectin domain-containing protein n=1 Tax=Dissoconium aciculare CBS 342.82 TaxID=1314786 RepID=A0A6J3MKI5_9PEZI|nr:uncharacterized protein K489DRAFT_17565 [Dissoconium aciculare CBS 342.82]KAF1827472.1 hypothetical protein K489DRAFT_17565 [Dissoconium aciculare CBS 342.82]